LRKRGTKTNETIFKETKLKRKILPASFDVPDLELIMELISFLMALASLDSIDSCKSISTSADETKLAIHFVKEIYKMSIPGYQKLSEIPGIPELEAIWV
jgi:hypothetical protein